MTLQNLFPREHFLILKNNFIYKYLFGFSDRSKMDILRLQDHHKLVKGKLSIMSTHLGDGKRILNLLRNTQEGRISEITHHLERKLEEGSHDLMQVILFVQPFTAPCMEYPGEDSLLSYEKSLVTSLLGAYPRTRYFSTFVPLNPGALNRNLAILGCFTVA